MSKHDNRCTSSKENWAKIWGEVKKFPRGRILHAAKNIWVEWRRFRRGECQDEHENL